MVEEVNSLKDVVQHEYEQIQRFQELESRGGALLTVIEQADGEEPQFLLAARQEAKKRGVSVEQVLGEQVEHISDPSNFPGPNCCFSRDELDQKAKSTGNASAEHLSSCFGCWLHVTMMNYGC